MKRTADTYGGERELSGDRRGARGSSSPGSAERPVILLVDDLAENLFALERLLSSDDVEIVSVRSGREALELLLQRSVALALIDVQMPEMDGFELATLMRGVDRTRHVPIIFVTAGSRDQQRVFAGYEAGAVDFLFKPIDPHVLRSKVDTFVALARHRQELRRSEERFRTLVQTTSHAVWRVAPDGVEVLEDSPGWRELTGESIGPRWLEGASLAALHPEDQARVSAAWRAAVDAREAWEFEFRVRRPDGRYTWTLARAAPVFGERGELLEWIGANTDIQARKEAEELRERFVGILGHDLRNPLNAIMVAAQLVMLRAQDEAIRTPIERVIASGERMGRLIEQILDLTRIRLGGGFELTLVAADLRDIVEQALAEIPSARGRLRFEAVADTRGTWDVDRLLQVVANIVGNAVEHSEPGSPIHVRLDGDAPDAVCLSVHNYGPAIPDSLRDVLFEPFRRVGQPKRHNSRGLGLGLFITKQLVLAHGGAITLDSGDSGTTFRVRLPRQSPAGRDEPAGL
jgi:PAS domain S-box-containing protein